MTRSAIKNRRASTRYNFVTALRYRAYRQTAITCSGMGRTIDMSAGGVAIEIGRVLEQGTEMELVLDWPGIYHGKQRMRLTLWGEVLRSTESGTSLKLLSHQFRNAATERAVA